MWLGDQPSFEHLVGGVLQRYTGSLRMELKHVCGVPDTHSEPRLQRALGSVDLGPLHPVGSWRSLVRELAQQGITVKGWLDDVSADTGQRDQSTERPESGPVSFRALLCITGGPVPEASCAASPTRPRLRIRRRHGR